VLRRNAFLVGSLIVHGALAVLVGEIEVKQSHAATAIEYAETAKKKPPEPAKVDPTPPPPKPERVRAIARPLAPAPAEAEPPKTPTSVADNLPDFGLSLSGGVNGTGMALPVGAGLHPQPVQKLVPKSLAPARPVLSECEEAPVKPRALSMPQPAYTEAARAADVQGKVRVQISVDETGRVTDVKLLQGLGYGLDELALAAARQARFEPGTRCGKPVSATFNVAMRFTL
jgi:periplasmic protein TonB